MSDRDRQLTKALSGLTWPTGEAIGRNVQALVDPFTGYTVITLQIPPSLKKSGLYALALDKAYELAVATIRADAGIFYLTVRVLVEVETTDGKRATLTAYRGNTTRETLDYYVKRGLNPDRKTIWELVFATSWWDPSVPTT